MVRPVWHPDLLSHPGSQDRFGRHIVTPDVVKCRSSVLPPYCRAREFSRKILSFKTPLSYSSRTPQGPPKSTANRLSNASLLLKLAWPPAASESLQHVQWNQRTPGRVGPGGRLVNDHRDARAGRRVVVGEPFARRGRLARAERRGAGRLADGRARSGRRLRGANSRVAAGGRDSRRPLPDPHAAPSV